MSNASLHNVSVLRPVVASPAAFFAAQQTAAAGDFDLAGMEILGTTRRRIKCGEPLYHAGENFTSIYIIRTGFFRSTMTLEDGREQITGFSMAGDIIGLDGIHSGKHSCSTAALEDSEVCVISYSRLQQASLHAPALQQYFHRLLGREITRDYRLMLLLGSMCAEERLASFLLNLSARYEARGYSASAFNLRMTRDEIGSYLGLKVETVSRALSKLQKLGFISIKGRRVGIPSVARLGAFLRGEALPPAAPAPVALCA